MKRSSSAVAAMVAVILAAGCSDNNSTSPDAARAADAAAGRGGSGGSAGSGGSGGSSLDGGQADGSAIGVTFDAGRDGSPAARLDDTQVLGVMLEANSGEVAAGQVATTRATAAVVKAFGMRMVDEHSAANRRLTSELMNLQLAPADSATRRELAMMAAQTTNMLWAAPMATFDQVYAQSQVEMHTQVLALIDNVLLPSATNTLLKSEVAAMRMTVVAHLNDARNLLGGGSDGGAPSADGGAPSADGGAADGVAAAQMRLGSPTLDDGGKFPPAHTAPTNESPELRWSNAPSDARSFAVTLTDLSNGLVHWVVWDIPSSTSRLPAGLSRTAMTLSDPPGAKQKDFMLMPGYLGPNPGPEYHTYRFDVWPLDVATLPMAEGKTTADIQTLVKMHTAAPASVGSLTAQGKTLGN
jgi:putative membrane protein